VMATAVTQVALPILSRIQNDRERLNRAYRSAMELTCVILYPCFVGISVTAPEAVELLFGRQWLASAPYVSAVALLIVVQAPKLLIGPTLSALGRPRDMLFGIGAEMLTILVLFGTLGADSIWAAVVIWSARELVSAPVLAGVLSRASGITLRQQASGAAVPLLASLTMALAVFAARRFLPTDLSAIARLGALVPMGIAVFVGALWLFDRRVVLRGVEFIGSALRRVTERPAAC
jgi:O-antigen/teichoic acid export membrane protein